MWSATTVEIRTIENRNGKMVLISLGHEMVGYVQSTADDMALFFMSIRDLRPVSYPGEMEPLSVQFLCEDLLHNFK